MKDPQTGTKSSWMRNVPDDIRLSMINIPGTHESLALLRRHPDLVNQMRAIDMGAGDGIENPRCQVRPPLLQLQAGLRILDCRFNIFNQPEPDVKCLYAWHGDGIIQAPQGHSCAAMLQAAALFLAENARETLIISIGDDPGDNNDSRKEQIVKAFQNDSRHYPNNLFYYPGQNGHPKHLNEIRLGDVRGRIILIHKNSFPTNDWVSRDTFFSSSVQGSERLLTNDHHRDWATQMTGEIEKNYKKSANPDFIIRVELPFGDNPTSPWETADGLKTDLFRLWTSDRLGRGLGWRLGIVMFDFYELFPGLIWNIIRSNKGCGDLMPDI
jgi:hypothetical protein